MAKKVKEELPDFNTLTIEGDNDLPDFNTLTIEEDTLKKKVQTEENLASTSELGGSTSGLEDTQSELPIQDIKNEIPPIDLSIQAPVQDNLQNQAQPPLDIPDSDHINRELTDLNFKIADLDEQIPSFQKALSDNKQQLDILDSQIADPSIDDETKKLISEQRNSVAKDFNATLESVNKISNEKASLEIERRNMVPDERFVVDESVSLAEGFLGAVERGVKQGEIVGLINLDKVPNREEIERIAELVKEQRQIPSTKSLEEFGKTEGFGEVLSFLTENKTNALDVFTQISAESMAALLRHGRVSIPASAAAGSVVPGIGTGIGLMAGMGGAGFTLESASSLMESLEEAGIDLSDPDSIEKGLQNKEVMDKARSFALKRGLTVTFFDVVSMGLGGRIIGKPISQIAKNMGVRTVRKAITGAAKNTGKIALESAVQTGLAGAGESSAQVVSGQEISASDIIGEMLGEGFGAKDIAVGAMINAKKAGKDIKKIAAKANLTQEEAVDMIDISQGIGEITKEQADELRNEHKQVVDAKESIPDDLKNDEEVVLNIEKKQRLQEELTQIEEEQSSVDESFKQKFEPRKIEIQSKIKEIDDQISSKVDKTTETKESPLPNLDVSLESESVEYKIGDQFFSEKEITGQLKDPKFVESVKNGDVDLSISNPSPAVSEALTKSGLLTENQTQTLNAEENVKETKTEEAKNEGKTVLEESVKDKVVSDTKVENNQKPVVSNDSKSLVDQVKNQKDLTVKDLDAIEAEADSKNIGSPELSDEIAKRRNEISDNNFTNNDAKEIEKELSKDHKFSFSISEKDGNINLATINTKSNNSDGKGNAKLLILDLKKKAASLNKKIFTTLSTELDPNTNIEGLRNLVEGLGFKKVEGNDYVFDPNDFSEKNKDSKTKEIDDKIAAAKEKFKKSFKGLSVGGLTKEGLEAIVELTGLYVQKGTIKTSQIIKNVISDLKDFGLNIPDNDVISEINKIDSFSKKKKAENKNKETKTRTTSQRISKSESSSISQKTRDLIDESSKTEVKSQKEADGVASDIFDKSSREEVLSVVRNRNIKIDSDVRLILMAKLIQDTDNQLNNKNLSNKEKSDIEKNLADLAIELSVITEDFGRGISILNFINNKYKAFDGHIKTAKIRRFNNEFLSKNNIDIDNESSKLTGDINDIINDNIEEVLKNKLIQDIINKNASRNKSSRNKKVDTFISKLDSLKIKSDKLFALPPGINLTPSLWNGAISIIQNSLKAGAKLADAIDLAIQHIKANKLKSDSFNEKSFREFVSEGSDDVDSVGVNDVTPKTIVDTAKEIGISIKDIVKSHLSDKKRASESIAEKLIEDFGLSENDAKEIQDKILSSIDDKAKKLLKSRFSKKPNISRKAKVIDRMIEDINLGSLESIDEGIRDLFFTKNGLLNVDGKEVSKKLRDFVDRINKAPGKLQSDRVKIELATFIKEKTGGYTLGDWVTQRFYTSVLSGPITHLKNTAYNVQAFLIVGTVQETFRNALKGKLLNPLSFIKGMYRGLVTKNAKIVQTVLLDGQQGALSGFNNDKGYAEYTKRRYTKFLNFFSTRMLSAADVFFTRSFEQEVFKNIIREKLINEDSKKPRSERRNSDELNQEVERVLGISEENIKSSENKAKRDLVEYYGDQYFNDDIISNVKSDKEFSPDFNDKSIYKKGISLRSRRILATDLLMNTDENLYDDFADKEKLETEWVDEWTKETPQQLSSDYAKNLALQGEVIGTIGGAIKVLNSVTQAVPALKFKIPFQRIMGKIMNMTLKGTPIIGQAQAGLRYATRKKSGGAFVLNKLGFIKGKDMEAWANQPISKEQASRDLRNLALITVGQTALFALTQGYDVDNEDDKDGEKIPGFIVTGKNSGNFFSNKNIVEGGGFSPFSVYTYSSSDKKYKKRFDYRYSPFGFVLSFFGALNDSKHFDKKIDRESYSQLFLNSITSSQLFIADKSIGGIVKDMLDIFDPIESAITNGGIVDDKLEIALFNMANTLTVGNIFKQATKTSRFALKKLSVSPKTAYQELFRGVPYFEDILMEKQVDDFGREMKQDLDIGVAILKQEEGIDNFYNFYVRHGKFPVFMREVKIKYINKDGQETDDIVRLTKQEKYMVNVFIGKERLNILNSKEIRKKKLISNRSKMIPEQEVDSFFKSLEKESKDRGIRSFFKNYFDHDNLSPENIIKNKIDIQFTN